MSEIERLPGCPLLACVPLGRSAECCYGKNGIRRACMLDGNKALLRWTGEDAWDGPPNFLTKQRNALKEEVTS